MTAESQSQPPSSEVFLSPRVVDREAFDDFAGVLRAIVDDAHALGGSIESGAVSAKKTLDALERSESALRPKIDMAARVLASMDERIERLESLLTRAERGAQSLEQAESRVAEMIDTRVRALESRIEDVVAGAEVRLNTSAVETTTRVEEALRATERSLEQAQTDTNAMHTDARNQLRDLADRLLEELTDATAARQRAGADQTHAPDPPPEANNPVKPDLTEELAKMTRAIETLVRGTAPAGDAPVATIEPKPVSRQPSPSD